MHRRNFITTIATLLPCSWAILPQAVRGTVCPTGYSSPQIPIAGSGPPPWLADWLRLPMQPLLHLSNIPANDNTPSSATSEQAPRWNSATTAEPRPANLADSPPFFLGV